ncbi:MAG: tetratricopeptide repeat protein [Cyanobacteria bacterium P01_A01_bin.17]
MNATTQWIPNRSAFDVAASSLKQLSGLLSTFSFANRCLGHAWLLLGQPQEAKACYQRVVELSPRYWGGHCRLGQVLGLLGQWEASEQSCRQSLQLRAYGQTYSTLGEALYRQGLYSEAVPILSEAVNQQPENAWSCYYLGLSLIQLDRWAEASDALGKACELNPDFVWVHHDYGKVQLRLENWAAAAAAFEKAAQLLPQERFHFQLGCRLAECDRWDEAVAAYRRAIEIEPDQPGVHQKMADCLRQRNRAGDAIEALALYYQEIEKHPEYLGNYHKALEINPTDAELHVKLADALAADARWDGAMCFYAIAAQLRPEAAGIHTKLGQVLIRRGNFERAVQHLHQALDLDPNAQRWSWLGQALAGYQQWSDAIEACEHALTLEPDLLSARLTLSIILIESGQVKESTVCLKETLDLSLTQGI